MKIANHTHLERASNGEAITIRLHSTQIVTYWRNGAIVVNSGGYRSTTTKARMNTVLPQRFGIFQKNHEWLVRIGRHEDKVTVPFFDGAVITELSPDERPAHV
jgi:hypothetical protein